MKAPSPLAAAADDGPLVGNDGTEPVVTLGHRTLQVLPDFRMPFTEGLERFLPLAVL